MDGAARGNLLDSLESCGKLPDATINELAKSKVFFTRVDANAPLFTRFDALIRFDGPPGKVVESLNFADVAATVPSATPQYAAWVLFAQQDWHGVDRCLGGQPTSFRLSLEYLSGAFADPNGPRYACTGACDQECPTSVSSGFAEAFVR